VLHGVAPQTVMALSAAPSDADKQAVRSAVDRVVKSPSRTDEAPPLPATPAAPLPGTDKPGGA
jgi:hypothetical protein